MRLKTPSRRSVLVLALVGMVLLSIVSVRVLATPSTKNYALHEQARFEQPTRLKIPRINVDAAVESVGLTSQGTMDVPKNPADAAWFNRGPSPGAKGSAVIDGHFGWKNGRSSVFDNLYKLHAGDKIYIEDGRGVTTTFVVREFRTYAEHDNAGGVFNSSDGKSHLNLITCEGLWNAAEKSYSNRLVIFADKEGTV